MGTPPLLAQCLPGLLPHDKTGQGAAIVSEQDPPLPGLAVEIIPSKNAHPYKYAVEDADLQGINIFTGKVSVADIVGFSSSEMISLKPEVGPLKAWESSIDLVNALKHEIRDGQLSFRGKRVLELGCSYGLPGIFACLKGASTVHFQDQNAETIRCTTIPTVIANLEQARDKHAHQEESPLTPSRQQLTHDVHFYAGDWEELHTVLSLVEIKELPLPMNLSFAEEDLLEGCSSQDVSIVGYENASRRSRKLSGSRAWERANEANSEDGGYDVVLVHELPSSVSSLEKLLVLITKCLRPPYGVLYFAAKKSFVGSKGGYRNLRALVDEEGIFRVHKLAEQADHETGKLIFK